ncbi:MAG: hypothetical protein HYX53_02270 [Chloroflexi bacterium]|nr:hypothetical protein [Chloroflexota bacterium]
MSYGRTDRGQARGRAHRDRLGLRRRIRARRAPGVGGDLYGVKHAGTLEVGAPADLVLVHGDPLSDPRALWRVWAVYQRGERVA